MKRVKLVTFVPNDHADAVREALGNAGVGNIGEYSFCSFSAAGVGRFKPSDNASPSVGEKGEINMVVEHRIEVEVAREHAKEAVKVIKQVHPYEEVVIDIYPLLEESEL